MLSDKQGKSIYKYVSDYVVFDLETTGTDTSYDKVVEIAAIKVIDGFVKEEFSFLVNPEMPIPFDASDVNGITDDMVKDAPTFDVVLNDFIAFIEDYPLVGHNINKFDMKFIYRDIKAFYGKTLSNDHIDTLQLAWQYLPQLKYCSLSDMADYYNITFKNAHRALGDCKVNQRVYENMKDDIENPSEAAKALKKCPRCGSVLKKRNGKFGEFWGCTGYPDCRYTENIRRS